MQTIEKVMAGSKALVKDEAEILHRTIEKEMKTVQERFKNVSADLFTRTGDIKDEVETLFRQDQSLEANHEHLKKLAETKTGCDDKIAA